MGRRGVAALALGAALLAGCGGPSEEDAVADLEALADDVMVTGGEVVATLESAGLEVDGAGGTGAYCQSEPAPGFGFTFAGQLAEGAAYDERVEVAREALVADGWEVVDEGERASEADGAPAPWFNLEREQWRLSLRDTVREGSDTLVFGLDSEGDCIRIPDGSVDIPEDLERVPLDE